jgi:ABC-type Fe3+ transport system permease subunit
MRISKLVGYELLGAGILLLTAFALETIIFGYPLSLAYVELWSGRESSISFDLLTIFLVAFIVPAIYPALIVFIGSIGAMVGRKYYFKKHPPEVPRRKRQWFYRGLALCITLYIIVWTPLIILMVRSEMEARKAQEEQAAQEAIDNEMFRNASTTPPPDILTIPPPSDN